jgi:hypothetical protein
MNITVVGAERTRGVGERSLGYCSTVLSCPVLSCPVLFCLVLDQHAGPGITHHRLLLHRQVPGTHAHTHTHTHTHTHIHTHTHTRGDLEFHPGSIINERHRPQPGMHVHSGITSQPATTHPISIIIHWLSSIPSKSLINTPNFAAVVQSRKSRRGIHHVGRLEHDRV